MAQDFNMMEPLIDGQGNYGSIDGDNAAAMRYCVTGDTLIPTNEGMLKIEKIAEGLKKDSEKDIDINIDSFESKTNKATKVFNSGTYPTKEIFTEEGYSIRGSNNHPLVILSMEGEKPTLEWKLLKDIKVGDFAVLDLNKNGVSSIKNHISMGEANSLGIDSIKSSSCIPDEVLYSSKSVQASFLEGLDSEAKDVEHSNRYCAAYVLHNDLAKQVQTLLLGFGLLSSRYSTEDNKTTLRVFTEDTTDKYKEEFKDLLREGNYEVEDGKYDNYTCLPIGCVQESDLETVYSIKVDSNCHSFTGNGFINHNTEMRMTKIGQSMLDNIHKDTIDYTLNFDNTTEEPTVLPTYFPNLLVNGGSGIAVGMSYSMPTHNPYDVYMALDYMIGSLLDGEIYEEDEIIDIIQAPDFPTGGVVVYDDNIKKGYKTGRGSTTMKAKCDVEEAGRRFNIVVTEIPYGVNKARLVSKIDELRATRLPEVRAVIDESSKEGIRIIIELKSGENPSLALAKLYKFTQMKINANMNFTLLNNGKPIVANLKTILESFIEHSLTILTRETEYDLNRATRRKHIIEGTLKCLDDIDEVIETIRASENNAETIDNLINDFGLTEDQAKAISDTRLRGLNKMSKSNLLEELESLNENIERWQSLLDNELLLLGELRNIYEDLRGEFDEGRKSEIVYSDKYANITQRDLVKEEDVIISITENGIIKSTLESEYRTSNRNTKGSRSLNIDDDDYIKYMFAANTKSNLLIITDKGFSHKLDVFEIPITSRNTKGRYINQYIDLDGDESILDVMEINEDDDISDKYVGMVTKQGLFKKISVENMITTRRVARVIRFREGDSLVKAMILDEEKDDILLATANGIGLRTSVKDINPIKGRNAMGVIGINLNEDDYVIGMANVSDDDELLLITSKGIGKRLSVDKVSAQGRNTRGVIVIKTTDKSSHLQDIMVVEDKDTILISTYEGLIVKTYVDDIPSTGRNTQGVYIVKLNTDDSVVSVCIGQPEDVENIEETEVEEIE